MSGKKRLSQETRNLIFTYLRAGHTQNQIAQMLGINRLTVQRYSDQLIDPHANYERCPECGHRVTMPCIECMAEKKRRDTLRERRKYGEPIPQRLVHRTYQ